MSLKSKVDSSPESDNSMPNPPAPVIYRSTATDENSKQLLKKHLAPAWVISGMIHVVLVASAILFNLCLGGPNHVKAKETAPTNTKMDEAPVPETDLTNQNVGLDWDLREAGNIERELDAAIMAAPIEQVPVGRPDSEKEFAQDPKKTNEPATPGKLGEGPPVISLPGPDAPLLPGFLGRSGAVKTKLIHSAGGNDESEAAVGRALVWLAKQQKDDGFWVFDGSSSEDRIAATGMCVLPFLASGETHMRGKLYKSVVAKGLKYLRSELKASGQFGKSGMYSQAIATIALCEAAGMTLDDGVKKDATRAVEFIVKAQTANGSWGYISGAEDGDTSIVGWQIQALKSAKLAGISVPDKVLKQAESFLVSVSDDNESRYGYRTKGGTHTLSAVGLLSRIYLMNNARHPAVARGVQHMWAENKPDEKVWDMYYYYYATQVVHFFDGKDWHQNWNPAMRKILLDKQDKQNTPNVKPANIGSWQMDTGFIGSSCGRLGTTALACLTLEVYYRHLPLNKRDNEGIDVLEGKQK